MRGEGHDVENRLPTSSRVLSALLLVAAACSSDDSGGEGSGNRADGGDAAAAVQVNYEAIGLWDDGPCDEMLEPLKIGLMTIFESPVLSLEDQATALEASAEAFNSREGPTAPASRSPPATTAATPTRRWAVCGRSTTPAWSATGQRPGHRRSGRRLWPPMAEAGIPRVASNVVSEDWGDQNAYPLDASGTGVTFLLPQALMEEDVSDIGLIRVDLAAASVLVGLLEDLYADEGATFPYDVPVPGGTTDFTQFILGAQDAGVGGVSLALGEQEAVQVARAGQQLGTDLLIGSSLGSFSQANVAELGDFAEQMVFLWSFAPATVDLPAYEALRQDLAASGEESLQPANLRADPMRSWIGLYVSAIHDSRRRHDRVHQGRHDHDARLRHSTWRSWTCTAARTGHQTPTTRASSHEAASITGRRGPGIPTARRPTGSNGNFVRGSDDPLRRRPLRLALRTRTTAEPLLLNSSVGGGDGRNKRILVVGPRESVGASVPSAMNWSANTMTRSAAPAAVAARCGSVPSSNSMVASGKISRSSSNGDEGAYKGLPRLSCWPYSLLG